MTLVDFLWLLGCCALPPLCVWLVSLAERYLWMRRVRDEAYDAESDRMLAVGMRGAVRRGWIMRDCK